MSFLVQFGIAVISAVWLSHIFLYTAYCVRSAKNELFWKFAKIVTEWAIWISVAVIFVWIGYTILSQYHSWINDPLARYYLPPHQSISYFIEYTAARYVAPSFIAIIAAFTVWFLADRYNRKYGNRFLEEKESSMFALGVMLSGYPGFLFYIIAMFCAGFLATLWYTFRRKGRAPFYFLWLPVALCGIVITYFLIPPDALVLFPF